jgi:hypothetical protein
MITNYSQALEHLDNAVRSEGDPALREALIGHGFALLADIDSRGIKPFAVTTPHIVDQHGRHWVRDEYSETYRRTTIENPAKTGKGWSLDDARQLMGGGRTLRLMLGLHRSPCDTRRRHDPVISLKALRHSYERSSAGSARARLRCCIDPSPGR